MIFLKIRRNPWHSALILLLQGSPVLGSDGGSNLRSCAMSLGRAVFMARGLVVHSSWYTFEMQWNGEESVRMLVSDHLLTNILLKAGYQTPLTCIEGYRLLAFSFTAGSRIIPISRKKPQRRMLERQKYPQMSTTASLPTPLLQHPERPRRDEDGLRLFLIQRIRRSNAATPGELVDVV